VRLPWTVMRLLVVEDEPKMADFLVRALAREGYVVDIATTGDEALWAATENDYAGILLDAMIPAPDGFDVCRQIRERERWVPIMLLTARDAVNDRVRGLDAGADDYLTKPFDLAELFARVRALVRRTPERRPAVLRVGDLELDPATHHVTRAGTALEITAKSFAVLEYLMHKPDQVVTRTELLDNVWDAAYDGSSNVVDVYAGRVRDVIDRPFSWPMLETVRGVGYRLRSSPTGHP
jgi:two-component system, OmpR family, response regulator